VRLSIPAVALRVVPVALAAAVYWPITANYFHADDFLHLYQVVNEPLAKFLVTPFGGHLYTVRNLAFTLLYHLFGPEPRWYFCAVLLTHLVNVALLQEVVLRLGAAPRAAAAGAALWGTAPVLEGSLAWFSAYGHVLVATALLGVLASAARVASGKTRASSLRLAVWYVALLAGATCYGTGIAVALAFPVVAFLLLPPGPDRRRSCAVLTSLWVVVPLLYVLSHRIWVEVYGGPAHALPMQIALALNWHAPAEMLGGLLAHGVASTHLGFFWPGKTGSAAVLVLTSGVYLACVVAALGCGSGLLRRQVLACAVLSLAIYALIAAGRGNLYTWIPDPEATPFRSAATSRYHYVGLTPLIIASCLIARALAGRFDLPARLRDVLLGLVIGAIVLGWWRSGWQIEHWAAERQKTVDVLARIRRTIAAAPAGRDVFIANRWFPGAGPLVSPREFPGWAAMFAIFFLDDRVEGRRVYFVTTDTEVLAAARDGRRSATLLIPPPPQARR